MESPSRARTVVRMSLAALAATTLAGCGGGSGGTGSPRSSKAAATSGASTTSTASQPSAKGPSRARFAASAGAICKRVNAELTVVKPKHASVAEVLRRVPGNTATEQRGAAELAALEPPAALAHDWRLLVLYRRTLADELAQLAHAAQKMDTKQIKSLSASKLRERRLLLRTAKRTGLSVCGTVG